MTIAAGAPVSRRTQARVAVPFAVFTLVWSSTWIVIRDQLGTVPPSWSIAYRMLIASAAMLAYGRITATRLRVTAAEARALIAYGIALYAVNFNLVYRSEAHIASGLVALLFALLIVPNALLGRLMLGDRLSRRFLVGCALALSGVGLLFVREWRSAPPARADDVVIGVSMVLVGLIACSFGNVVQGRPVLKAMAMPAVIGWGMLAGGLADAAFAWITTGPPVLDPRPGYWAGLLYLGLIGSALCFPLYFGVIRAIGPARAAYSGVLVPFIAMTISTLFEGYRWSAEAAIGGLLALAGLVVALRARMESSPAR